MKQLIDGIGTIGLLTLLAGGAAMYVYFAWRGYQAFRADERRRLREAALRAEDEQKRWEDEHGITAVMT